MDFLVEKTEAREYLIALSFGVIPLFFIYTILRSFVDALGHTRITMIISLLSLPVLFSLTIFYF
ncbi:hypothetical protein KHA80_00695 [Anaerobacillus sp. HL2]|nr:hypothetical protein KHA80_00695 [Anaerobacillus sp. HL2]